jgi:hypothetical protein
MSGSGNAADYGDDDDDKKDAASGAGASSRFKEFDCPSCSANNPADPPFGNDDEVLCNYCGTEYKARVSDEGRLKLREV